MTQQEQKTINQVQTKQAISINLAGSNFASNQQIFTPTLYPTAGSHTYKVRIGSANVGTMQYNGTTGMPAYIRVELVKI